MPSEGRACRGWAWRRVPGWEGWGRGAVCGGCGAGARCGASLRGDGGAMARVPAAPGKWSGAAFGGHSIVRPAPPRSAAPGARVGRLARTVLGTCGGRAGLAARKALFPCLGVDRLVNRMGEVRPVEIVTNRRSAWEGMRPVTAW
ncbi:hypothetical protein GCM10023259_035130 [Thermocatellispora tengchongensis]